MLIYKIRIPKETDAEAFITFVREEYIPAVYKGPSRLGAVTDLVLFQGNTTDSNLDQFFLHIEGSNINELFRHIAGNSEYPPVDEEAQNKFNSFGARLEFLGEYRGVAAWHQRLDKIGMGEIMLISEIQLPKDTDSEAFVTFMDEEYIPAVDKSLSRRGQVTDLVLLKGNNTNVSTDQFFWHIYGDGVYSYPRVDEEAQSKFDSFGARLEFLGNYREVAAWQKRF